MSVLKIRNEDGTWKEVWGATTDVSGGGMTEQVQADWSETDSTSPAYIKNKPVISGDGGASVQADWNQNDPTQADYIKNKPFGGGEVVSLVDILPLSQHNDFYFNEQFGVCCKDIQTFSILSIGETYVVHWDGTDYECVAQDISVILGTGAVGLGNGSAFGFSGNNEPFIVALSNNYLTLISLTDTEAGGSHTVRISREVTIVKQIDKKFIPIPFFGETNITEYLIDGSYKYVYKTDSEGNSFWELESLIPITSDIHLTAGETYTIVFNGVEYVSDCETQDGVAFVGNLPFVSDSGDNGIPFVIAEDTTGNAFGEAGFILLLIEDPDPSVTTEVTYDIKLAFNGLVTKKIDTKYLYQPDWNEHDESSGAYIKNKPFGTITAGTIIVPKTTVYLNSTMGTGYYSIVPTIGLESGYTYEIIFDDVSYTCTAETDSNGTIQINCVNENGDIFTGICDNYGGSGMSVVFSLTSGGHTYSIAYAEDIVKKIDYKYLPDDIGGGSSLPEVTTDNNGQVMTVVDGVWTVQTPASGLPDITSNDDNKVLKVINGAWVTSAETQELPVVTSDDNDKVLTVVDGVWSTSTITHPNELPTITTDDAGKFLRVSPEGTWIVETIQDVSEVGL